MRATRCCVQIEGFRYWPDDPAKRFSTMFRSWFALQGSVIDGLPKHCKYLRTNVTRCLYPEYFADEIATRLFPLQSLYDPDQHMAGKLPAQVTQIQMPSPFLHLSFPPSLDLAPPARPPAHRDAQVTPIASHGAMLRSTSTATGFSPP